MRINLFKEHIELTHAAAFIKYVVAGVTSVVVQFGALIILVEQAMMNQTIAAVAGFCFGCIVNYIMLYYWAFRAKGKHYVVFAKYTLVMSVSLLLNTVIFWVLTEPLLIPYLISQSITTVIIGIINFLINQRYTFFSPPVIEIEED